MRRDTWEELQNEKVCAIDIDDTISDSTPFWIDFVNKTKGTLFKDLDILKTSLSYDEYRRIKKEYRTSGIKEDIPVIKDASELTKGLKKLGYKIVIITARPNNDYPVLSKITLNWLNKNNIEYDAIIFDKKKHIKVLEMAPHLRFSINDHRTEVNLLSLWGYKSFLINNKYNQGEIGANVIRVKDLKEVLERVKELND